MSQASSSTETAVGSALLYTTAKSWSVKAQRAPLALCTLLHPEATVIRH